MTPHDFLIQCSSAGHVGLCRGCGTTTFAAGYTEAIDLSGSCQPVPSSHSWTFTVAGKAYAACTACGTIRAGIPFDGANRYPPLDLSGECSAVAVPV